LITFCWMHVMLVRVHATPCLKPEVYKRVPCHRVTLLLTLILNRDWAVTSFTILVFTTCGGRVVLQWM
jgi:hypothetical protein